MIIQQHYINNSPVRTPKNWLDLGIELNYGKDQFPNANVVTINDFEWVAENYVLIKKYIDDGLTGGVGIFEGMPYRIDLIYGNDTRTIFNGFIDLTNGLNIKDRIKIIVKATSHATVDWVASVSGFTFQYLASDNFKNTGLPGYISADLYKFVPYVNSKIPNYEQAAMCTLMAFSVANSLIDTIEKLYNLCAAIVQNWSDFEIAEVIDIIIKIIYLILLLTTIAKLIEDIYKFIISPIKYHACMYVRDLMEKAVDYISEGKMTFSSDIWDKNSPYYNEVIMPEKFFNAPNKADNSIFGFLVPDKNEQIGYYKGTFAQLLDAMKIKYNAKIVVAADKNGKGIFYFIRRDKNALNPQYQLPDIYQPEYTYNTDEIISTYLIEYTIDGQEQNTLQNYAGTQYEVETQPKLVNNRAFVLFKNYQNNTIPFARASRKTSLSTPEKIMAEAMKDLDKFLIEMNKILGHLTKFYDKIGKSKALDYILSGGTFVLFKKLFKKQFAAFNATPAQAYLGMMLGGPVYLLGTKLDLINKLKNAQGFSDTTDRMGMMLLSNDHTNIPKIFILKEGSNYKYNRIHPDNDSLESSKAMWDGFHYVNSFVPAQLNPAYSDRPSGNQFMIKNFEKVPFTWKNYLDVVDNNKIFDAQGNEAIVESLKFNPAKQIASMRVRFSKIYTLNLQEFLLNPTGS